MLKMKERVFVEQLLENEDILSRIDGDSQSGILKGWSFKPFSTIQRTSKSKKTINLNPNSTDTVSRKESSIRLIQSRKRTIRMIPHILKRRKNDSKSPSNIKQDGAFAALYPMKVCFLSPDRIRGQAAPLKQQSRPRAIKTPARLIRPLKVPETSLCSKTRKISFGEKKQQKFQQFMDIIKKGSMRKMWFVGRKNFAKDIEKFRSTNSEF